MIRELPRQLHTLSLVLNGEQGSFNPSTLHRRTDSPDRGRVADLNGRVSFHGSASK
jgi:hypothetical protein